MKADIVLMISSENPLMSQLNKILGKFCSMYDFSKIMPDGSFLPNDKVYSMIRHIESGLIIKYTSESRLGL